MANLTFSFRFPFSSSLFIFLCLVCFLEKGSSSHHAGEIAQQSNDLIVDATTHHFVQLTSLLPSATCRSSVKGGTRKEGASMRVSHKNGPCSPLSTSNQLNSFNLIELLNRDQARVRSIQSRLSNYPTQNLFGDNKAATVVPAKRGGAFSTGNYVVTIGLGTPKQDLSLVFDTGSDLAWVQCKPCSKQCYSQKEPIFNPIASTSYRNVSCEASVCAVLRSDPQTPRDCSSSTCVYKVGYLDGSYTQGIFVREKISLTPKDGFDEFYLGCGIDNKGMFGEAAGLLGLGRGTFSIVTQAEEKYGKYFSYCLPSTPSSTGHLTFGKTTPSKKVQYTSLVTNPNDTSLYFIEVVGISVGGKKLPIPSSIFSNAGTVIDSGTVITWLPKTVYAAVRTAFRQKMKKYPMVPKVLNFDTCYNLTNYLKEGFHVPKVSFHFSGGAKWDVDESGTIIMVDSPSQVCLAMTGNENDSSVGLFGNYQQKTFEVIHDVAGGKLGFSPRGCA